MMLGFGIVLCLSGPATPAEAIPVFDAGNYAQNVLQAARALEQINNQIHSLQNQAVMLEGLAKNLSHLDYSSLSRLSQDLAAISQLVHSAQGISFDVEAARQQFAALFSSGAVGTSTTSALQGATARLQAAQAAFQQSVVLQSQVTAGAENDMSTLSTLVEKSQAADGNLQATQITNQLLALVAKQQSELQQLMAAQSRAQSLQQSSDIQAAAEARAATRRFLGSGTNYTPQ
jgi:type IV secretion system protein TrbJ